MEDEEESESIILFDNSNACHMTEPFTITEESVMTTLSEPHYIVTDVCDESMTSLSVMPSVASSMSDPHSYNIEIETVDDNICLSNSQCIASDSQRGVGKVSLLDSQNYMITTVEENGNNTEPGAYGSTIMEAEDENDLSSSSIAQTQNIVIVSAHDFNSLISEPHSIVTDSLVTNLSESQNEVTTLLDSDDLVTTSLSDSHDVVTTSKLLLHHVNLIKDPDDVVTTSLSDSHDVVTTSLSDSHDVVTTSLSDSHDVVTTSKLLLHHVNLIKDPDDDDEVTSLSDSQNIVTLKFPNDDATDSQNTVAALSDPSDMVIALSQPSDLVDETVGEPEASFSESDNFIAEPIKENHYTNSQDFILPVSFDSQDSSLADTQCLSIQLSLDSQETSSSESPSLPTELSEKIESDLSAGIVADGNIPDRTINGGKIADDRLQEAELIINLKTPRRRAGVVVSDVIEKDKFDNQAFEKENTVETLTIERKEFHECYICKMKFKSITNLFKHRVAHNEQIQNTFKCDLCDQSFTEPNLLTKHKLLHIEVRVFRCGICLESFNDAETFNYHAQVHECEGPFVCNICSQVFDKRQNYLTHHALHRPKGLNITRNILECEVCSKVFTEAHKLKRHLMYHNGDKYHRCGVCQKSFVERSKLTRHMLTHTGKRDYTCSVCGKSFTLKFNLQQHLKIHQGIRPHKCEVCGKTFIQRVVMQRHMKVHEIHIENY